MSRRKFKLIQGGSTGTSGTLYCCCNQAHDKFPDYDSCGCTEERFFARDAPRMWMCGNCVQGQHKFRM